MRADAFFEKFDLLADAPDSVARMRELVLELAVRGALSERLADDQNEEVWRDFLAQIEKRMSEPPVSSDTSFDIPSAWRWVRLDDLGTTRVRNDAEDDKPASFVPMASVSSTYGVAVQSEERNWGEIKKGFTHFADGDVVMAKITPCFENAKSAVMRNLVNGIGAGTTELHVFRRATPVVLPEFVLLFVKTRGYISRGVPRMTGSAGQKRIPRDYFSKSPFPLPPPAEQKRIVAKVDELMALCDRLEAQQQERETRHAALARASLARFSSAPIPANLSFLFHPSYAISPADLRKSILTLAVQGKLVPQAPDDEPVAVLIDRIDAARYELQRTGIVPKQKPLAEINERDCHHSVPKTWRWVRLQRAAEIIDPNPSHRMPRYCASGIPFISTENFVGQEEIDFSIGKQIDEAELEGQKRRFSIREGAFALSRIGTIGKTRILPLERNYGMSHALVVIAPYSRDIDSHFLRMVVSSDAVQGQAAHGAKSIGVPDLGMGKIRSFVIPFPPIAEQRRIVAKVRQLMALVDQLEARLTASRAAAKKLLDAIVAELTTT